MALLQRKLALLIKEADPDLRALMQRAWLLGPKQIGPNILASSSSGLHPSPPPPPLRGKLARMLIPPRALKLSVRLSEPLVPCSACLINLAVLFYQWHWGCCSR